MAEREVVIDKMRLSYEGLFKVTDLYKLIDGWLREKGYDKREKKMIESVTKDGKFIEWEMEPWKKITDYAKIVIGLRMIMTDIKEVDVEVDKSKVKLNQGKIDFVFDGYLETDYENRWESKPLFYFLRTVFDKYIFKPYSTGYHSNTLDDVNDLHVRIKSFLNLYRYADVSWSAPANTYPAH
jgi:hypothetical protein|tara:strand:- start:1107 stop:1652 length:546 start_codon:yes stop_codon:yes gene_type:complete